MPKSKTRVNWMFNSMEAKKNREVDRKTVNFPITLSVKMDWDTRKTIDKIALFEKKKPSTWARDVILERIRTYERNPQYKKFERQLEEMRKEKE